jgi:hypothetical protein
MSYSVALGEPKKKILIHLAARLFSLAEVKAIGQRQPVVSCLNHVYLLFAEIRSSSCSSADILCQHAKYSNLQYQLTTYEIEGTSL